MVSPSMRPLGTLNRCVYALAGAGRWILPALVISLGVVSLTRAVTPQQDTLKLTPLPALSATGDAQAANLFDRDTGTAWQPQAAQQVLVPLEAPTQVRALAVYGPAAYVLNVQAQVASGWQPVTGLQNVNLATLPERWNTLPVAVPVTAAQLRLDLTPVADPAAGGLKEIEVLGAAERSFALTPQQLLAGLESKTPPMQGRLYAAPQKQGAIGDDGRGIDDPADNRFSIDINRNPADFKRAWLVHEASGITHWSAGLRAINGNSVQGDWLLPRASSWSTQLEEINPAWLVRGANRIEFSAGVAGAYSVRNVRLMVQLEDGTNFVRRVAGTGANPSAAYDGDLATGWAPYGALNVASGATLEAHFEKPTQVSGLRLNLGGSLAGQVAVSYLSQGNWIDSGYTALNAATLVSGWNPLNYPTNLAVDGVRLTFQGGAGSTGQVRELVVSGSGVGARAGGPAINLGYPDAGQFVGRQAYIRGFVTPIDNGSGPARIEVGGHELEQTDGAFGAVVGKDDVGLAAQADRDPWSVEIVASWRDGSTVRRTVTLDRYSEPVVGKDKNGQPTLYSAVPPGQARKLAYSGAELLIGADALDKSVTFGMTPLREQDMPRLDTGMTNVTKGPPRGFRFTPHGARFKNKIKVVLPYDRASLPPGHTDQDVRTFYFDEQAGRWMVLERAQVDSARGVIVSYTDHFTDMINATITVPDHPNPASLNPTSIKDIKAADPGAQVNLIEPPKANNMGDARLAYPIELAPGRNGLQPSLAVQYNSGGGNGWMGMGWDIAMQSVSIDTRWGVPRYDPALETETYTLDGESLTPVAHRGELKPRSAEKVFHTRIEGQFRRIVRHGGAPSAYWWEVTDKNGTRYFYGGRPEGGLDPNAVLADPASGNVFRWALKEVRDTNGNNILYTYDIVNGGAGGEPWRQIYLKRINYTGHQGSTGPYEVSFQRSGGRTDVIVDGRPGFKTVMDQRLTGIDVSLASAPSPLIRRYRFDYVTAAFKKTLLTKVTQYGEDGVTEFNHHDFEYYDEARDSSGAYHGFAPATDWGVGSDNISAGLLGKGLASALGGTRGKSVGGHLYVGIGPPGKATSKVNTVGVKVGYSRSTSDGLLTMADMNGDGLPDKVFKGGGGFYYRPNKSGPRGTPSFGEPVPLPSLPAVLHEKVTSTTIGAEAYPGSVSVLADRNRSFTQADRYLSDVNGDGLTDLVSGGRVLFGYINAAGVPTFSANSADTPVAIGTSIVDTNGLLEDYSEVEAERAAAFPLVDTVRRWVAPYDGVVQIDAPVRLLQVTTEDRASYDGADGVRVAIQLAGAELWSAAIGPTDFTIHTPAGLAAVPVRRGDALYFRVQSVKDGAYDQVDWNGQIRYLNVDAAKADVNGLPVYVYGAAQDFTLAGRMGTMIAPLTGVLHLGGTWEKTSVTTDDATVVIKRNGAEIYRRTLAFAETASVTLSEDLQVAQGDELSWQVLVDSPVDVSKLRFAPLAYYTSAQGLDAVTDDEGNYVVQLPVLYDLDLYPVDALTAPQVSYPAPATGTLNVQAMVQITGLAAGERTAAVFTVKRRGALLGKRVIEFTGTGANLEQGVSLSVQATAGDELFFDLSSRDPQWPTRIGKLEVKANGAVVPSAWHARGADGLFGQPYRGWSAVAYNGNGQRATQPIDPSAFLVEPGYDANNARAYPLVPRSSPEPMWLGPDDGVWVKRSQLSASRLGLDDIRVPTAAQFAGSAAVSRLSESINNSLSGSVSFPGGASVGGGGSKGTAKSKLEFQDLNGDRYPDVISNGGVQYTTMTGPLEPATRSVGLGMARESETTSINASAGGNMGSTTANGRAQVIPNGNTPAPTSAQGADMPPLGFGGSIGGGTSEAKYDLVDINADGLPDKVYRDGRVALNLGYRFAAPEPWSVGTVNDGETRNVGTNLGFNMDSYSIAGGLNLQIGDSRTDEAYVDVNGDGLPDKVYAGSPFMVRINTGAAFTDPVPWPNGQSGKVAVDKHISLGGGAYITFGFNFLYVRLVFNPGVNASTSMGRPEYAFRDMDGDGYADYVYSDKDSKLSVAGNFIGRTHLLKRVVRPLRASMEFGYTRDGNTYDQPHSKWTLTRVTVNDGHPGDGVDTLLTTYEYQNGYYDRAEREFYGYAKVIETQRDITQGESAYRRNTSEYLNRAYPTKGLLARTVMEDGAGRAFTESRNQYDPVVVADGAAIPGDENRSATVFPQLVRSDHAWYEGQGSAGKQTYTTHKYDEYGNVVEFFDAGDVGADDDVRAAIAYTRDTANWIVGKPTRITVDGAGRLMRMREASYSPGTANLVQVRQFLENGQAAVTDLAYNANGTLASVLGPVNHRGQRYRLDYTYDPVVATHITGIVDSFGLSSSATHHYKYGKVLNTTDTNNNPTDYAYDQFGRTVAITGPYQTGTGQATLRMEYHPEAATPWARTRHLDVFRNAADPIDTVLFTDGLKRVIQTKKDITLHTGPTSAPADVMSVSGRVVYDAMGRAIAQHYPVTESLGNPGAFNAAVDTIQPTRTEYDVLDRTTRTVLPDNTATTMQYGFGSDRDGLTQFQTVVTDANGKRKVSYRDVQEQITAVQEFLAGQTLWTSYRYDPLKQIVEVRDDRNHLTQATYDNLGRRIALDNPDTGRTDSQFDLAGNLVAKVTANLRAQGKAIHYTYDFLRLAKVSYPNFPGNDISYEYGAPRAPYNRAGRIVQVSDQGGREQRFYGKLGEVVKEIKTIASDTQGNSPNSPEVWTTEYLFDTFGRLQRLVYPDGEVLSYAYDAGGNVKFAQGVKQGVSFNYLTRLEYDKFEQRQYLSFGNGSTTQYAYDARNRRLANLQAVTQGRTIQNLHYRYDNVGNILGLANQVAVPAPSLMGGPTTQSFAYDDLYRLTQAGGSWDYAPNKRERYSLAMAYDTIHNITAKTQLHEVIQPGGSAIEQKKTSYDWKYEYQSSHPHAPTHLGERSYKYDANGNQLGWDNDKNGTRRNIVWDDENRIQSVFDNGHEKRYKYDDQGERVIKRGPQGETAYVNQWYTVRNREVASKHVYAGTTRIATSLVPGVKPVGGGGSTTSGTPVTTSTESKLPETAQQAPGILKGQGVARRSEQAAQHARNLEKNPHYATTGGGGGTAPGGGTASNQDNFLYYYHPDHLGSSSYVTDAIGKVYEHLEYFPFGETWVEESSNTQRTPYLFTAKELDEETGLYYFGARYYDPRVSVWQSPDPILGRYLDGKPNAGVYGSKNLSMYSYAYSNPVKLIDPDGRAVETPWDVFNVALGTASFAYNVHEGNYGWAAVDALGLAYDGVATAVPFLPAGASTGLKAYRLGNSAADAFAIGRDFANVSKYADDAVKASKDFAGTAAAAGTKIHGKVAEVLGEAAGKAGKLSEGASSFFKGATKSSGKQPDLSWGGSGLWADLTTKGSWGAHVKKYGQKFGEGVGLIYERGKGIVDRIRLPTGGGLTTSTMQGANELRQ